MLSHGNVLAVLAACKFSDINITNKDRHLSYLPLAHIFEKAVINGIYCFGAKIGFYNGDVLKLKEDLGLWKPTIFASVPRLYNKFYDAIMKNINDAKGLKKSIADFAIKSKLKNLANDADYKHKLWDALVFNKIKKVFGGHVRVMITAAAPISENVINFLKVAF